MNSNGKRLYFFIAAPLVKKYKPASITIIFHEIDSTAGARSKYTINYTMTLRKIAALATVLIASIVLIILIYCHTNRMVPEERELLLKDFQKKNCSEMLFIERLDTARLKRKGLTWKLVTPCIPVFPAAFKNSLGTLFPEYPVDSALLAKALETIGKMKQEELMSVNPKKQAELEVDGKSGLSFECWDSAGLSLGRIYIGEGGPVSGSYFVRKKESDSVYMVGGGIRFSLFANPKRWADKSIVKFDKNLAQKLAIVSADSGTLEMEKKEPASSSDTGSKGEWYIVRPVQAKANQHRVESLISNMSNLKAADFEGDKKLSEKDIGFDRPATITTITLSNGKSKTVVVGSKDKAAMKWVQNPEKPGVTFTVYGYTLAGFNPGTAYFKDSTARDTLSPVEAAKSAIEKQIEGSIKNAK